MKVYSYLKIFKGALLLLLLIVVDDSSCGNMVCSNSNSRVESWYGRVSCYDIVMVTYSDMNNSLKALPRHARYIEQKAVRSLCAEKSTVLNSQAAVIDSVVVDDIEELVLLQQLAETYITANSLNWNLALNPLMEIALATNFATNEECRLEGFDLQVSSQTNACTYFSPSTKKISTGICRIPQSFRPDFFTLGFCEATVNLSNPLSLQPPWGTIGVVRPLYTPNTISFGGPIRLRCGHVLCDVSNALDYYCCGGNLDKCCDKLKKWVIVAIIVSLMIFAGVSTVCIAYWVQFRDDAPSLPVGASAVHSRRSALGGAQRRPDVEADMERLMNEENIAAEGEKPAKEADEGGTTRKEGESGINANEGGTTRRDGESGINADEGGTTRKDGESGINADEGGTTLKDGESGINADEGGTTRKDGESVINADEGGTTRKDGESDINADEGGTTRKDGESGINVDEGGTTRKDGEPDINADEGGTTRKDGESVINIDEGGTALKGGESKGTGPGGKAQVGTALKGGESKGTGPGGKAQVGTALKGGESKGIGPGGKAQVGTALKGGESKGTGPVGKAQVGTALKGGESKGIGPGGKAQGRPAFFMRHC